MNWTRREILKKFSLGAAATVLGAKNMEGRKPLQKTDSASQNTVLPKINHSERDWKPSRPVRVIVAGAGNRGWGAYSSYGLSYPDELQVVGVAEPVPYRRERISKAFNIPEEHQFVTWEHIFDKPKFADALFITTPDHLHYGPSMAGLELGYDLLLEKVIAQTWQECNDILQLAQKKNAIVAVCHVLRYTPYYRKLKQLVETGEIGEIISVEHTELLHHLHMAHSFVRGNWANSKESNPIILSKSCHDTDLLRWIIDKPCNKVSSFGSLNHFRESSAPPGSTRRCTDGCAVERECPYSAVKHYLDQRRRMGSLMLEESTTETITRALKEGPYGRCVYRCDNDVMDSQVTNFVFDQNIPVSFNLKGVSNYDVRITRICGSEGEIFSDGNTHQISNFSRETSYRWDPREEVDEVLLRSGHLGGDHGLVRDFVKAVYLQKPEILSSGIEVSMASHLMGFMAEKSRLQGVVSEVNM